MSALGQHAKPHTVWIGIDNRYYVNCQRDGITPLPSGKGTTHCPACAFRLVPLTEIVTDWVDDGKTLGEEY
jgi:hypothetical protein